MLSLLLLCLLCAAVVSDAKSPVTPREVVKSRASQLSVARNSTACADACSLLSSQLPQSVFPGRTGNFGFWNGRQAELTPACRVEPSSAREVSQVLKTVIDTRCHFAIKSGGHDSTPGSNNAEDGVTIDLVRLDKVDIAKDRKSVKIGAGLRWAELYYELEKQNLTAVGGRVADIGVGGLTLGGGISFYSNRNGWACDNVLSFEIVLPDTSIQTITQQSHPDIYRALRGAGASNFGIVTSFILEAFELSNPLGLWSGSKVYEWSKLSDLADLNYQFYTKTVDQDPNVAIIHFFAWFQDSDAWLGSIFCVHLTHTDPLIWPEPFQPYEKLEGVPNTTATSVQPLSNLTIQQVSSYNRSERYLLGTFTYRPSATLEQKIATIVREEADAVKNKLNGFLPSGIFQPLSRNMLKKMETRGGNALGLAAEIVEPLEIFVLTWTWYLSSDDEISLQSHARVLERAEEAAKNLGLWHPYKYINYASRDQDVWSGAGKENLRELRRVQRQVDPLGVFTDGGLASGWFNLNEKPE